jgi:hypothetical protein
MHSRCAVPLTSRARPESRVQTQLMASTSDDHREYTMKCPIALRAACFCRKPCVKMQNSLRSSTHNTGCRPHARPSPLRVVTLGRLCCFDLLVHLQRVAARLLFLIHIILHFVTRFLIWCHKRLGALQQHRLQCAPDETVQLCGRTTHLCLALVSIASSCFTLNSSRTWSSFADALKY